MARLAADIPCEYSERPSLAGSPHPTTLPEDPLIDADALADAGFVTDCTFKPTQDADAEAYAVALNNEDAPAGRAHIAINTNAFAIAGDELSRTETSSSVRAVISAIVAAF